MIAQLETEAILNSMAFSPDEEYLAASVGRVRPVGGNEYDYPIMVWGVVKREQVAVFWTRRTSKIETLEFSPDGRWPLAASIQRLACGICARIISWPR